MKKGRFNHSKLVELVLSVILLCLFAVGGAFYLRARLEEGISREQNHEKPENSPPIDRRRF